LVDKFVLIPRPETELLAEAVKNVIQPNWTCIDVGTGCGCIAITLAKESVTRWVATDTSSDALRVAKKNAGILEAEVLFQLADLLDAVRDRSVDLIVCNPPYIAVGDSRVEDGVRKWEPNAALYAGPTGLEVIERLARDAERAIKPNGLLAFEFGMGQAEAVRHILKDWQYEVHRDLSGIERFVLARAAG
jgi:release factor glutamine methyltransferase